MKWRRTRGQYAPPGHPLDTRFDYTIEAAHEVNGRKKYGCVAIVIMGVFLGLGLALIGVLLAILL